MHCQISYIETVEKKRQGFLQSFNLPKCIVLGSLMVEGLFSLLFYWEVLINMLDRENNKCFWGLFMFLWEDNILVKLFLCFVQYMKKSIF